MKIILSPAKKMNTDEDALPCLGLPVFLEKTEILLDFLRQQPVAELKRIWNCSDQIVRQNLIRLEEMDLFHHLTPAVLAYEGLAYRYMAPSVLEDSQLRYIEEHLRILSGFYGVLKPMDGVRPYRLEMQSKIFLPGFQNLYEFWGDSLYREVRDDIIINLASEEYAKCIRSYLDPEVRFVTCIFAEEVNGKLVQKGTFAKMARGEMVRYLTEQESESPEVMQGFHRLGYQFRDDCSSDTEYVFQRVTL